MLKKDLFLCSDISDQPLFKDAFEKLSAAGELHVLLKSKLQNKLNIDNYSNHIYYLFSNSRNNLIQMLSTVLSLRKITFNRIFIMYYGPLWILLSLVLKGNRRYQLMKDGSYSDFFQGLIQYFINKVICKLNALIDHSVNIFIKIVFNPLKNILICIEITYQNIMITIKNRYYNIRNYIYYKTKLLYNKINVFLKNKKDKMEIFIRNLLEKIKESIWGIIKKILNIPPSFYDLYEISFQKVAINQLSRGFPFPPHEITLKPTMICNLKCVFCNHTVEKPDFELPLDKWLEIVRDAANIGTRYIHISGGGEPLCVPNVTLPIIKEVKKLGLKGSLTTNGTLLTKNISELLVKSAWDMLYFSIDDPLPQKHDKLRGQEGCLEKIITNMKTLNNLKKANNSKYPQLFMDYVLTSFNWMDMIELVDFAKQYGFVDIKFIPCSDISNINLLLDKDELNHWIKLAKKVRKMLDKYKISHNLNYIISNPILLSKDIFNEKNFIETFFKKEDLFCFFAFLCFIINADGTAAPCHIITSTDYLSNIKDKTLMETWLGEELTSIRQQFTRKIIPGICKTCPACMVIENMDTKKRLYRKFRL